MKKVWMVGFLAGSIMGGVQAVDCQAVGLVLTSAGSWSVCHGKHDSEVCGADFAQCTAVAYVCNKSPYPVNVTVKNDQDLGEQFIDIAARILVSLRRFVRNPCDGDIDDAISERYAIAGPFSGLKFLWKDALLRGKQYCLASNETLWVDLLLSEKEYGLWRAGHVEQLFTVARA